MRACVGERDIEEGGNVCVCVRGTSKMGVICVCVRDRDIEQGGNVCVCE